ADVLDPDEIERRLAREQPTVDRPVEVLVSEEARHRSPGGQTGGPAGDPSTPLARWRGRPPAAVQTPGRTRPGRRQTRPGAGGNGRSPNARPPGSRCRTGTRSPPGTHPLDRPPARLPK